MFISNKPCSLFISYSKISIPNSNFGFARISLLIKVAPTLAIIESFSTKFIILSKMLNVLFLYIEPKLCE